MSERTPQDLFDGSAMGFFEDWQKAVLNHSKGLHFFLSDIPDVPAAGRHDAHLDNLRSIICNLLVLHRDVMMGRLELLDRTDATDALSEMASLSHDILQHAAESFEHWQDMQRPHGDPDAEHRLTKSDLL